MLTPDDTRRVVQAAFASGATAPATHLAGPLFALTSDPDAAAGLAQAMARSGRKLTALARSSASRAAAFSAFFGVSRQRKPSGTGPPEETLDALTEATVGVR